MHRPEDDVGVAPAHSRISSLARCVPALVEQPTVKSRPHSLREVCQQPSSHGADLYLLDSVEKNFASSGIYRAVDAPPSELGTKISRIGAAAQALDQKEPVFCQMYPRKC